MFIATLALALAAACTPAMRPNAVPIAMPIPAVYPLPNTLPAIISPATNKLGLGLPSKCTAAVSLVAKPR
ncbi:hypothetical protein D3C76_1677110 [compost metagenome]